MSDFRKLLIWQMAKDLAVSIYRFSNQEPIKNDFGLRDQIRRSSVSVASNIAEGEGLDTDKQSVKHLYISRGSLAELRTQLQIAYEIGYIEEESFMSFDIECDKISAMITKLIRHKSK